jgi:hypothetical protein
MYLSLCSDQEAVFRNSSGIQAHEPPPGVSTTSVIPSERRQFSTWHRWNTPEQQEFSSSITSTLRYQHFVTVEEKGGGGYRRIHQTRPKRQDRSLFHTFSFVFFFSAAASFHNSSHRRFFLVHCLPTRTFCTFGLITGLAFFVSKHASMLGYLFMQTSNSTFLNYTFCLFCQEGQIK